MASKQLDTNHLGWMTWFSILPLEIFKSFFFFFMCVSRFVRLIFDGQKMKRFRLSAMARLSAVPSIEKRGEMYDRLYWFYRSASHRTGPGNRENKSAELCPMHRLNLHLKSDNVQISRNWELNERLLAGGVGGGFIICWLDPDQTERCSQLYKMRSQKAQPSCGAWLTSAWITTIGRRVQLCCVCPDIIIKESGIL